MFDMIRMDFRRISRSKGIYIAFFVLAVMVVFCLFLVKTTLDPQIQSMLTDSGFQVYINGEGLPEVLRAPYTELLSSTVFRGGVFFIVLSILASLFICTDFDSGFAKNIFSLRASRFSYLISKWLCFQIVALIYILLLIGAFILACRAFHLPFTQSEADDYTKFVLIFWLATGGYTAMLTAFSLFFRSKAAAIAAALLLASGTVLQALQSIAGVLKLDFIRFEYTIYGSVENITFPAVQDTFMRCITVSIAWTIVWLILSALVLQKRDI